MNRYTNEMERKGARLRDQLKNSFMHVKDKQIKTKINSFNKLHLFGQYDWPRHVMSDEEQQP